MKSSHDTGHVANRLINEICEYAQSSGVIKITNTPSNDEVRQHHITGVLTLCLLLAPFLL